MSFKPTGKRMFVRRIDEAETILDSGLIVPNSVRKEVIRRGVITAVGPEVEPRFKPGDRVLYVRVVGVQSDIVELKDITIMHDHEAIAHEANEDRLVLDMARLTGETEAA